MTASSKIARLADLVATESLRASQYLSGRSQGTGQPDSPAFEVTSECEVGGFLRQAGEFLQHTGEVQKEFGHGKIIYDLITRLSNNLPSSEHLNVLEFGTARGFSSLVMAKALQDARRPGSVLSIDIIRNDSASFAARGCPPNNRYSRKSLLDPWRQLVEDRIFFLSGSSQLILEVLQSRRFQFVFIDEHHVYRNTIRDLYYSSRDQLAGDQILLDDFSEQFPGVVRAVDDFLREGRYEGEIIEVAGNRRMALLKRCK